MIDPRYACFALRLDRSGIHRWGVYAAQNIPAKRKVIEYTGEKINRRQTKLAWDGGSITFSRWTITGASMEAWAEAAPSSSTTPAIPT